MITSNTDFSNEIYLQSTDPDGNKTSYLAATLNDATKPESSLLSILIFSAFGVVVIIALVLFLVISKKKREASLAKYRNM